MLGNLDLNLLSQVVSPGTYSVEKENSIYKLQTYAKLGTQSSGRIRQKLDIQHIQKLAIPVLKAVDNILFNNA
ncbi:MAG: hypothetical protein CLLPBCKN_006862 [Chroococcidiopsis cubana SAG 39.79]|uniref:Uncharacterized protein n=1 Tax=Chroococcidiopsis cubana SAG 39.79 TaxID=388085 RepID=A0AB37UIP5_9CYAN|nr:hypothetical protein [Chroococcidiopsis cubana SAG 39.79]PSB61916.1 hypothetical protein C7B79_20170 [Chroococcidiopsis cubana CCALA 043]RUT11234.1 hypothetical protein DSM107010_35030 [Chroococcidiopsis cubana SAG 39.79]